MVAHAFEALALVALLSWGMALIATVLHDVVRHEPRTLTTPAPDTGMTAQGVPWVAGPKMTGYDLGELREIARERRIECAEAARRARRGPTRRGTASSAP